MIKSSPIVLLIPLLGGPSQTLRLLRDRVYHFWPGSMSRSEREVKDLESLCEFFSEGALRAPAFAGALGRSLLYGSVRRRAALDRPCAMSRRRALGALGSLRAWRRPMSGGSTRWRWALALGSGWLRGVSPEQ